LGIVVAANNDTLDVAAADVVVALVVAELASGGVLRGTAVRRTTRAGDGLGVVVAADAITPITPIRSTTTVRGSKSTGGGDKSDDGELHFGG
jgi:hypothetical protein